ncbi:MAG: hypothetical protein AABX32_04135 [Nanoarchaeota archaeon]
MEKKERVPEWFYYVSILVAFLFTMYISIYAAIHFESIKYMNTVVVFFFMTMAMFFMISAVYFKTEKLGYHTLAPILFFAGIVSLILYAFKAVDASNIVQYSIIYTIIVSGISVFFLLQKDKAPVQATTVPAQEIKFPVETKADLVEESIVPVQTITVKATPISAVVKKVKSAKKKSRKSKDSI